MNANQKAFFDNLEELRKINFADMFHGVSNGDMCMMKLLRERTVKAEEIRVSEIVEAMRAPAPAVSRTLKGLEQKGLLQRQTDFRDRRNTFVTLTEEGLNLATDIDDEMGSLAEAVLQQIGEETFVRLKQDLGKLIDATKEQLQNRLDK